VVPTTAQTHHKTIGGDVSKKDGNKMGLLNAYKGKGLREKARKKRETGVDKGRSWWETNPTRLK